MIAPPAQRLAMFIGTFWPLSNSSASAILFWSEIGIAVFGVIVAVGVYGETSKKPALKAREHLFAWLVVVGVTGEVFGDAGVLVSSERLQTISNAEITRLNRETIRLDGEVIKAEDSAREASSSAFNASTGATTALNNAATAQGTAKTGLENAARALKNAADAQKLAASDEERAGVLEGQESATRREVLTGEARSRLLVGDGYDSLVDSLKPFAGQKVDVRFGPAGLPESNSEVIETAFSLTNVFTGARWISRAPVPTNSGGRGILIVTGKDAPAKTVAVSRSLARILVALPMYCIVIRDADLSRPKQTTLEDAGAPPVTPDLIVVEVLQHP